MKQVIIRTNGGSKTCDILKDLSDKYRQCHIKNPELLYVCLSETVNIHQKKVGGHHRFLEDRLYGY